MVDPGEEAPSFELPAVESGEITRTALADYLDDDIVILAFYPADFNPSCSDETTDLDELDLFRMQKDVSVVAISGDSVYSHRAFAAEYDLHVPLLADVHGEVAEQYGVAVDDPEAGYRTNRAVVVVDPGGEVQYVWQTSDLARLPPVDDVRDAVEDIGGDDTAEARYRVGHAHYVEGRRAFTSAMQGFEDLEWMIARGDFDRAHEEFAEAADQFNTAVRFAEDETALTHFEHAEEKAEALWQAAEWLAEAASAYASGEGAEGERLRSDAEHPLETARDIPEPPDPDDLPPEDDPDRTDADSTESVLPTDDEASEPTLDVDVSESESTATVDVTDPEHSEASTDATTPAPAASHTDDGPGDDDTPGDDTRDATADGDTEDTIDDEELEEITAELEEQTEQAPSPDSDAAGAVPDDPDDFEGDRSDEEVELDLSDPTEGRDVDPDEAADVDGDDDDEEDDELGTGDHGVPDSL